jgi:hypothetical protein
MVKVFDDAKAFISPLMNVRAYIWKSLELAGKAMVAKLAASSLLTQLRDEI